MTAVGQRVVLEPAAQDLTEATAATRAAVAQATAFLRAALGTE